MFLRHSSFNSIVLGKNAGLCLSFAEEGKRLSCADNVSEKKLPQFLGRLPTIQQPGQVTRKIQDIS